MLFMLESVSHISCLKLQAYRISSMSLEHMRGIGSQNARALARVIEIADTCVGDMMRGV